jgi:hypothetical protein
MAGIKETKEVVIAATDIAIAIVKQVKDGVQFSDALALAAALSSDPLKSEINDALSDINQVPAELKDLNAIEGIELASTVLAKIMAGLS